MRNSTLVMPPQKPISELNPPRAWAYFDLSDGTVDSTSTVIANDSRATPLADFAITGTLGTFWSDRPGFASPNGSAAAQLLLANEPALADVCEYNGNLVIIGFSVLMRNYSGSTQYVMYMGGNYGGTLTGMSIRRTNTGFGRMGCVMYSEAGADFTTISTPNWGNKYPIASVGLGATPLVTTDSAHNLKVGHWVYLSSTDTTPVIDGMYQVNTVPSSTTFTIATANITGAGTGAGYVSPEAYAFLVIDGVAGEAKWYMIQKGTQDVDGTGTLVDIEHPTTGAPGSKFVDSGNENLTLFDRRQLDSALNQGQFRRMLVMNYGATTLAEAIPDLVTKLIPKLADSDMVPIWELED